MPSSCLLEHLDEHTRARVNQLADRLGVSASRAAHLACTTDKLFTAPEQAEPPRFMRLVKKG